MCSVTGGSFRIITCHRKHITLDESQHFNLVSKNRLLQLLSITPVSLNKDSNATELGGEDRYLLATVAKAEYCCL